MQIRKLLLTSLLVGLTACAEGETISGNSSGSGGGGGSTGVGGSTSGECGLTTNDATCDSCINSKCFASCDACATNQQCLDYLTCLQNCAADDTVCEGTCAGQYPTGKPLLDAFIGTTGCMTVSCEAECSTQGCGLTTGDTTCDDCMNTYCYTECMACVNESQCLDLSSCIANCADDACAETCVDAYPNGVDPLMNLLGSDGCLELSCSVECG